MIRLAYCISSHQVVGASTAADLVRSNLANLHDFVCADSHCREKGVRVLLAAVHSDSVFPYFMTCTREASCLKAMGLNAGVKLAANDAHVPGCQLYDSPSPGTKKTAGNQLVTDDPTVLKPGATFSIRVAHPEKAPAVLRSTKPERNSSNHEKRKNGDLHDLVDAMRYWPTDFSGRQIIVGGISRSIEDLFIDAGELDDLSFRNNSALRGRAKGDEDLTQTFHVYFGAAKIIAVREGSHLIKFDGGIDHSLAFGDSRMLFPDTQLSSFVDDQLIDRSAKPRIYRQMMRDVDILGKHSGRAFVFILGRLRCFKNGYLNIVPWQSAWDIVILPGTNKKQFADLISYVSECRKTINRRRINEKRQVAASRTTQQWQAGIVAEKTARETMKSSALESSRVHENLKAFMFTKMLIQPQGRPQRLFQSH